MYQDGGYLYRVIASEDNTKVTIPGQPLVLLDTAGKYYTANVFDAEAIYVSADKPICVVQYMKGKACNDG